MKAIKCPKCGRIIDLYVKPNGTGGKTYGYNPDEGKYESYKNNTQYEVFGKCPSGCDIVEYFMENEETTKEALKAYDEQIQKAYEEIEL